MARSVILAAATILSSATANAAPQSALAPGGTQAASIAAQWWIMAAVAIIILTLVIALIWIGLRRDDASRDSTHHRLFIVGGGVLLPVIVLTALIVYTLLAQRGLTAAGGEPPLRIHVIAKQWWWEIHYLGMGADGDDLVSANELHIPVGRPVEFLLDTTDVIHSFWIPSLAGKVDMIPGRTNRLRITAEHAGIYRGQCAEYCGLQHSWMALYAVALPSDDFDAWLAAERRPAPAPEIAIHRRGREAFLEWGCGACHTVRGTPADGRLGPDLTRVGARRSLAAGALGNGIGPLAGWIAGSQTIKPGNRMPSFNEMDGPTLRAIATWLESLK